ncbi:DUF1156 domain-containing protein [Methanopyrus kandleri]|uniref:DUF1156 domain-containing protein n=1 Tax=Methanopyrus kandleri TaxID=2320 RepID=A0A832T241_9EURY|nr:DUF1156 domain-containing protein [Methanopyrus kandleri]HII70530.1 DUF1156 domain-containing protein [Methanopyrus kandleri]
MVAEDLVPTEEIPKYDSERVLSKGVDRFYKLFNERQLLVHAELLGVIRELCEGLDEEYREPLTVYAMIAFDKMINYNTICSRWHYGRGAVVGIFDQHAYAWSWDHGEMGAVPGWWDFGVKGVLEAYEEFIRLLRGVKERPRVILGDARKLPTLLEEKPDTIVVDPPYYTTSSTPSSPTSSTCS